MQQPPLNSQFHNGERVKMLQARMDQWLAQMIPAAAKSNREAFEQVLQQSPDDYFVHGNFALFLKSIGDINSAITQWQRVCALIPQDSFASYQLGRLLEIQGQSVEAESCLRKSVVMRPFMTDGWVELGNSLASQKKFEPALAAYQHAREQRPQDSQIFFLMGKADASLNRHNEAIQDYREAIKLDPTNWQSHFMLGGELDASGQEEAACIEFADSAQLNPNYSRAHFNYGVVLAKLGRLDEAQREFTKALQLEPGYRNALEGLARIQALKQRN
jgi:tetratricopeptide (TPR) repeat protein